MDPIVNARSGETLAHRELKRLALVWAQAKGFSACALEVSLPQCRYRADLAAYRARGSKCTAIFECKQALPDLRRDNCCTSATRRRLESVYQRRRVLEKHLRVHYPNLRVNDSLFPEFASHDFAAIQHNGYARVMRELDSLQNRLNDCTKFETLMRYRCANVFFIVVTEQLFRPAEIPIGWGALIAKGGALELVEKPVWHENTPTQRLRFLQRIASAGTRALNLQLGVTFEEISAEQQRM